MQINPFDLLKNVQALQAQMGDMQKKLESVSVTGSAGGDMVEVELNGLIELQSIRISPEAMRDVSKEVLESLIISAFEDARNKVKDAIGREIGGLAGIPGISSSLFAGMA
jgi:DNA-binding YbaB/EbfC family protein